MRRAVAWLSAMFAAGAFAQSAVTTWDERTLRTLADGEPIAVVTRASGGRLTGLSIDTRGVRIDVPRAELEDLQHPDLNSVQILFGTLAAAPGEPPEAGGGRAVPYHSIRVTFGERIFEGAPPHSEALFVFWGGRYRERWIRHSHGAGEWRYETKRPGEPAEAATAESVLGGARAAPR